MLTSRAEGLEHLGDSGDGLFWLNGGGRVLLNGTVPIAENANRMDADVPE